MERKLKELTQKKHKKQTDKIKFKNHKTTKEAKVNQKAKMSTATTSTDTQTTITLKGSIQIVSKFFHTAINSILYQRGIYQPETFRRDSKYGLTVLITTDNGLLEYLDNVMKQMEVWLGDGDEQRLVVVVTGLDSGETLERWQYNVAVDKDASNENAGDSTNSRNNSAKVGKKSIRDIHNEIQAIIRQITASVSLLFAFVLDYL